MVRSLNMHSTNLTNTSRNHLKLKAIAKGKKKENLPQPTLKSTIKNKPKKTPNNDKTPTKPTNNNKTLKIHQKPPTKTNITNCRHITCAVKLQDPTKKMRRKRILKLFCLSTWNCIGGKKGGERDFLGVKSETDQSQPWIENLLKSVLDTIKFSDAKCKNSIEKLIYKTRSVTWNIPWSQGT